LEQRQVQAIEIAVKQAKEDMQEKLEQSTNKIDELTHQLQQLEKQRAVDTDTINQITTLKSKLNDELIATVESHKKEMEIFKDEMETIKAKAKEETDKLEKYIQSMQELHDEEIELVKNEAQEEIQRIQNSNPSDVTEHATFQEMKSKLEEELALLKSKIDSAQSEKDELFTNSRNLESRIGSILENAEKEKIDQERRIKELESGHRREIDSLTAELTAELDLVEAENVEKMRKYEEALKDKETVICAIGSQLAESESRFNASSESLDQLRIEARQLKEDLQTMKSEKQAKEQEIIKLIEKHQQDIEEHTALTEKAVQEAANEIRSQAQAQFNERNEMYRRLKSTYDEATSKISVLERDLRFAKKELDEVKKRHEAREADLKDELAQTKAGE
jgi:chromosome segregation ATPase